MRNDGRTDSDFLAEVESHIRLETDRLIEEGMTPVDAERAARRSFGNVTQARERFYESERWLWWEELRRDLVFAFRLLRNAPSFAFAVALTIALGVGANTAVFSLIDAVLLQSLPVKDPKSLVFLEAAGSEGSSGAPPYPCFVRLREETGSFEGLATFSSDELRVEVDGKAEPAMGQVASGNYFEVLGVKPALGRLMNSDDEKMNPPVAVISDRFWRRRFGADPAVLGRTIYFREQAFTIIGVTPPEFTGLQPGTPVDLTMPITVEREHLSASGDWWLHAAVGRLKPGASGDQAEAEADVVFQSFMKDSTFPTELINKRFRHLKLEAAGHGMDSLRQRFSKPLVALMCIVVFVLLLATSNIANLMLSRGITRQREFAIRLAAGAGRGRLMRQLATETLLLFVLGVIPAIALAVWAVGSIEGLLAVGRRAISLDAGLNWRVLLFCAGVTLLSGFASSLFPAWQVFRIGPEQGIKNGQARSSESRASARVRATLIAFQVALSLVLLVGAVSFLRTLANLRSVDLGFRHDETLTMSVEIPDGHLRDERSGAIWNAVLEAVHTIPGVRSAGLATYTPLSGRDRGWVVKVRGFQPATFEESIVHINQVSEGYFETFGIDLIRGRRLDPGDREGATKVVVINAATARKYYGERDPLGESLDFSPQGTQDLVYRIVGVVEDTKHLNLREESARFAYLPLRQPRDQERRVTLAVRASAPNGEENLVGPIRKKLEAVDAEILVSEVITVKRQLDSTLLTERILSGLSTAFGVLALLMTSIGLYGVLSYWIGQQRQAIGVRMAIGATPTSIAIRVMRQSGAVVFAGVLCGLPFAFLAARTADSMLWGVQSSDLTIYLAGAALLAVVSALSSYFPARRASSIPPTEALRNG